jgi:type I restriction enzyme M protein
MKLDIKIEKNKVFAPLKNKWLIRTPEETVRQNIIAKLVNEYGYELEQMEQEIKVTNSKRGTGGAYADVVIWKNKDERIERKYAFIVIECKAENVKIQTVDYFQGLNYAAFSKAKFFVTHNEKETKYFKVQEGKIPEELEEITDIPLAKDINNQKEIERLLNQTKVFTRDDFQKLLFACHNVIRNNDKLSPEMAFDEISKILFMKIFYERKQGLKLFSINRFKELKKNYEDTVAKPRPFYQELFDQTKAAFERDEIFEDNDTIRIRENSFISIVRLLEKYNLSDTSDDIKGIAFEEFLGKTFRGDLGQFFTPRTIVNFMVEVLDPKEGELVCDPCCGTGGFLIKAFEHIKDEIENDIQKAKKKIRKKLIKSNFDKLEVTVQERILNKVNESFAKLNYDLESSNRKSRLFNLSSRFIYGTDAEPRSARTAKMNMIMHGDGHGGVHHHDGLLNVNGIFENRFDVIITNPPFGARVAKDLTISEADKFKDLESIKFYTEMFGDTYLEALNQVNNNVGEKVIDLFDLGKFSTLTEVLFMERCLRLLKPGGRLGIVLPEGFLNNSDLQKIRDYFESKSKILLICSIPQDVFIAAGATVKPSLVFLKKFTLTEQDIYNKIFKEVKSEIDIKYTDIENGLKDKLEALKKLKGYDKTEKNKLQKMLKDNSLRKHNLINTETKKRFDYEIAIVKVEKAGITSTGAPTDNELLEVVKEFNKYRINNKLWQILKKPVVYEIIDDDIFRVVVDEGKQLYE